MCGLWMQPRVLEVAHEDVHVGMRVVARLEKLPGGDFVVPVFVPAQG